MEAANRSISEPDSTREVTSRRAAKEAGGRAQSCQGAQITTTNLSVRLLILWVPRAPSPRLGMRRELPFLLEFPDARKEVLALRCSPRAHANGVYSGLLFLLQVQLFSPQRKTCSSGEFNYAKSTAIRTRQVQVEFRVSLEGLVLPLTHSLDTSDKDTQVSLHSSPSYAPPCPRVRVEVRVRACGAVRCSRPSNPRDGGTEPRLVLEAEAGA